MWKLFGSGYYPSVVINNRTFRGDLNSDSVFMAICAGFAKQPSVCGTNLLDPNPVIMISSDEGISGNVLIAVVVLLVFVNVILIILYRRCTNKDIQDDMKL